MTSLCDGVETKVNNITDRFIKVKSYITNNIYEANWVYKDIDHSFHNSTFYISKLRPYGLNNMYMSAALYLPFKFNEIYKVNRR